MLMLTFFQSIVMGLLQGISELFPVSSLGHSVLIPYIFGWHNLVNAQSSKSENFFLAFIVMLHVATATALAIFYRKQWALLIKGFFRTLKTRKITNSHERLVWLLIIATIPAGITGLALEHVFRTIFAKPLAATVFLLINGGILWSGDIYARKQAKKREEFSLESTTAHTAKTISVKRAGIIGTAQVFALLAGISRSGVTIVSGLFSGLDYEDSARFSFLLATPIIGAAGIYKLPDFLGPNGNGVRWQILAGAVVAGIAAYISVRFLDKYFRTQRLKPFAIYCLGFGFIMLAVQLIK
jgi:undecaprenyl-diphosphatase